jgi:hypothetical protein
MKEKVRFLGLDVHADRIGVAVAQPGGDAGLQEGALPQGGGQRSQFLKSAFTAP